MSKATVAVVFGTRPEAIKMVPVIKALQMAGGISTVTISTGQHREMLKPVLSRFGVTVDYEMNLMEPNQSLYRLSGKAFGEFERVLSISKPSFCLYRATRPPRF